jgi:uncharacterized protein (UPF0261 family)
VTVLIPTRGFSGIDSAGQPFGDAEADVAFVEALRAGLSPSVRVLALDHHINDPAFADACASALLEMLSAQR